MARLSDFQQQAPVRNFEAERLCDANSKRISQGIVNYQDTHIGMTEGAAESIPIPYLRDAAIISVSRRQHLHKLMNQMCCDSGLDEGEAERFHRKLDHLMDGDERDKNHLSSESEEEPEEHDDELEEEESHLSDAVRSKRMTRLLHDALNTVMSGRRGSRGFVQAKTSRSSDSKRRAGYICDSDFIARYLNPETFCIDAENQLRARVIKAQADDSARGYWSGLFYFLRNQPDGSRIKDCRQATLSTLLSKTLAA